MDLIRIEADGLIIEAWSECTKKNGSSGDVHLTVQGPDDEPVLSQTVARVLGLALMAITEQETV